MLYDDIKTKTSLKSNNYNKCSRNSRQPNKKSLKKLLHPLFEINSVSQEKKNKNENNSDPFGAWQFEIIVDT